MLIPSGHHHCRSPRSLLHLLTTIALLIGCTLAKAEIALPSLSKVELDPAIKGQILIEELNCVACHDAGSNQKKDSRKAPRLSLVGERVHPDYLQSFIENPHGIKPGTTMPDLLTSLAPKDRAVAAKALTHFLLSRGRNNFSPRAPDRVAAAQGRELFHSRGCVACHSPRDSEGKETLPESSVPLGQLEKKYSFRALATFLRNPHLVRPSGRMPNMNLQGQDAEIIAHYLLQKTRVPGHLAYTLHRGLVWEGLDSENVTPNRSGHVKDFHLESLGRIQHQTALEYEGWLNLEKEGQYSFHIRMNGGTLQIGDRILLHEPPSNRRGPKNLSNTVSLKTGRLKIELTYFHTGRDPSFEFEMQGPGFPRASIPSAMLSVEKNPVPQFTPWKIDSKLAEDGRRLFGTLGCARCHDDLDVHSQPANPFTRLKPANGCLSGTQGNWPQFDLSEEQSQLVSAALQTSWKSPLDEGQRIKKTLTTFNCIACHERSGLGGIAPNRNAFFSGTSPEMGDQGRLPPPLTHVGAKLTGDWLRKVLLEGGRQRDYLNANMPQYGEANVGHLVDLFPKVDQLESTSIPEITDIEAARSVGHRIVGTAGFSCIACHDFNGQKSAGVGALDLVHVTDRLQRNWFHLYMRNPARFHPSVIMPSYWPGGQSLMPKVLNGDSARQIEALWLYLSDGSKAPKPEGLSRQSNELRVADVAEIARGRGTAGFRGIGVGYPEGIHLAFDSEEMALRLLWKGDFVNIDNGSFRARGSDRIEFPPGIPFHRLESMDADWPYKQKSDYTFPQDHGYQFRGYMLDEIRRPTFLYEYGGIQIEDRFEDVAGPDGNAFFVRTLRFQTEASPPPFHFRAAAGKSIKAISPREFQLDRLRLRITSEGHEATVRDGDPAEALILLNLPKGQSVLTLEYQW